MAIARPSGADAVGIAVFARAPVPGQCKTRLIPVLGPDGAADLHRRMIERTVRCATLADTGQVSLWCAPDASDGTFADLGRTLQIALRVQEGADLGERMRHAFDVQPPGYPLLLVGTDCPALTPDLLRSCACCLREGDDAVFLPSDDGGYVLVGLRTPQPVLFDAMTWSTDRVMRETRRRLTRLGLRWREPATLWDVDTPADLARLRASGLMPAG
jgi:rSAM/selenodomain-associated transferase 1